MFKVIFRKKLEEKSSLFEKDITVQNSKGLIVESSMLVTETWVGNLKFSIAEGSNEIVISQDPAGEKFPEGKVIKIASDSKEKPGGSGSGGQLPPPILIIEG